MINNNINNFNDDTVDSSFSYNHRSKFLCSSSSSSSSGKLECSSSTATIKNNISLSTTLQNHLYCSNTVIQRRDYPVVETFLTTGINEGV
jgi:hypothetical protein